MAGSVTMLSLHVSVRKKVRKMQPRYLYIILPKQLGHCGEQTKETCHTDRLVFFFGESQLCCKQIDYQFLNYI